MNMYVKCKPCPTCKTVNRVPVEENDFYEWQRGELAQVAFPYLSGEQREMLTTGYCGKCWNAVFAEMEEEW